MAMRDVGTAADDATREEELRWFCVRSVTHVDDKRTFMVVNYNNINQRGCVDLIGPRVVVVFPNFTLTCSHVIVSIASSTPPR